MNLSLQAPGHISKGESLGLFLPGGTRVNTSHSSLRSVTNTQMRKRRTGKLCSAEQSLMTFHQNMAPLNSGSSSVLPGAVAGLQRRLAPQPQYTRSTGFLSTSFAFPPVHLTKGDEQVDEQGRVFRKTVPTTGHPKALRWKSSCQLRSMGRWNPEARELGR